MRLRSEPLGASSVVLGGIWIGPGWGNRGDGSRPDLGEPNARATVRAALDAGITEIDTAPWYGAGASEERLGQALRVLSPETRAGLLVHTKAGRLFREAASGAPCVRGFDRPGAPPICTRVCVNDYTAEGARTSLSESLERLGLMNEIACPRLGLRIHDPNDNSNNRKGASASWVDEVALAMGETGMCAGLRELRAAGVICHASLGMNCNREEHMGAPDEIIRLLRGCPVGTFDSALLAGGWNLLSQEGLPCLEECERLGVPV